MAESLDLVAIIAGVFTALGVVLDWGVAPSTKQNIQTKLEGLLYRFRYTTLRTFGRDEVLFSMRFFSVFGEDFFSTRRVIAVLLVYLLSTTLLVVFVYGIRIVWTKSPTAGPEFATRELVHLAVSAFFFSLSISYTVLISRLFINTRLGVSIVGTFALILTHLILLVLWRPIVATVTISVPLLYDNFPFNIYYWLALLVGEFPILAYRDSLQGLPKVVLDQLGLTFYRPIVGDVYYAAVSSHVDAIMAMVSNALRLLLALFFFVAVLYVICIRPSLIWFWTALVRSPALFSPPLSALAAVILAVDKRDAIISALARPFQ